MERFWSKVDKAPDCWEWNAALNNKGYGIFLWKGKPKLSHRVAWMLHTGASDLLPPEDKLLHSCDNTKCVNPDHLRIGTQKDNARDMMERGRWGRGTGRRQQEYCKRGHKLSEEARIRGRVRECIPCKKIRYEESRGMAYGGA
jgi:hypothetical protein